jgi:hypothetical protein
MDKREWFESGLSREFRSTIQAWQDRTGLSESAIGHLCGFSQSVVNRWKSPTLDWLVQPQRPSLVKLAPKIGIDLEELERQAGLREDPVPATAKPVELQTFLSDQEAGWWAAAEHERPIRAAMARAALPHNRRPNRRIRGNNGGLDRSKGDYRKHKSNA